MSFASPAYPALLLVVVLVHRALPREWRRRWLLAASAVFYGWHDPALPVFLGLAALSDWAIARGSPAWAPFAAAKNLAMLAWFQYVAPLFGWPALVPLGASFYLLQSTGYVLDVARGRIAARQDPLDVLLFVGFFPQLVAGPLERAEDLLPQHDAARAATEDEVWEGVTLLAWGAFQKLVVADTLAPWVDRAFAAERAGGPVIWAAAAAFMVQVYADLSGYTDLARGSSLLLGIRLSRNFDAPWRAATTPEFWSRWHRTVTRFARDHVLAPLLGDGTSARRRAGATLATLLLLGAWHGAGAHFLVFGALHGAAWLGFQALAGWAPWRGRWRPLFALGHLATIGWVGALVFREPDLGRLAGHFARAPWQGGPDEQIAGAAILGMALLLGAPLVVGARTAERWPSPDRVWRAALVSVLLSACALLWRPADADFLYFQF